MATKKRTRNRKKCAKGAKHFIIGNPKNGGDSSLVLSHQIKGTGVNEYHFSDDTKNKRNTKAMWSEEIGLKKLQDFFAATIQHLDLQFAIIWRIETSEKLWCWNTKLNQWQTPPQYEAFKLQQKEAEKTAYLEQKRLARENAMYRLFLPLAPHYQASHKERTGYSNIVEWCADADTQDGQPFYQFRQLIEKNRHCCGGVQSAYVYDNHTKDTTRYIARIDINTGAIIYRK